MHELLPEAYPCDSFHDIMFYPVFEIKFCEASSFFSSNLFSAWSNYFYSTWRDALIVTQSQREGKVGWLSYILWFWHILRHHFSIMSPTSKGTTFKHIYGLRTWDSWLICENFCKNKTKNKIPADKVFLKYAVICKRQL